MRNIFEEIVNLLASGKKTVLARIVRQVGSAPRSLGTKCIVLENGSIVGTIGGGSLEHRVIEKSKDVFKQGKSSLLHFQLTGKELAEPEMLCGGIVDVFLEPLFPENNTVDKVFQIANQVVADGRKGSLLTQVAAGIDFKDENSRLLVDDNGSKIGSLGDMLMESDEEILAEWCAAGKPALIETESKTIPSAIFIEPVQPDDILYLFGAGHISTFVAPLAKMAGFHVVVIDDRQEFANAQRFPNADGLIVCPFEEAFDQISINRSAYIGIITRGHNYDRDVLRWTLDTGAAYIGMIGSRRKRNVIYKAMLEEGISQKRLDEIHSPIGLEIGAETPEEIAICIVAELIQTRAHSRRAV